MPETSKREAALQALFTTLSGVAGPDYKRNESEGGRIPSGGLVVQRDGDPGDPEVYLSPTNYAYTHRAEVVVQVAGANSTVRDAAMDTILRGHGAAIEADTTLGGAVDYATPGAPEDVLDDFIEGAENIKAVLYPVFLEYDSPTPLG